MLGEGELVRLVVVDKLWVHFLLKLDHVEKEDVWNPPLSRGYIFQGLVLVFEDHPEVRVKRPLVGINLWD